jgi:hypothetical protein
MTHPTSIQGYDIVRRIDGSFAIYDFDWWPDDYLDNDPEMNEWYLDMTGGWRASGWAVVHVAPTYQRALNWVNHVPDDPTFNIKDI